MIVFIRGASNNVVLYFPLRLDFVDRNRMLNGLGDNSDNSVAGDLDTMAVVVVADVTATGSGSLEVSSTTLSMVVSVSTVVSGFCTSFFLPLLRLLLDFLVGVTNDDAVVSASLESSAPGVVSTVVSMASVEVCSCGVTGGDGSMLMGVRLVQSKSSFKCICRDNGDGVSMHAGSALEGAKTPACSALSTSVMKANVCVAEEFSLFSSQLLTGTFHHNLPKFDAT